jgi:hypothetical protein
MLGSLGNGTLKGTGILGVLAVGFIVTSAGGSATSNASGTFGSLLTFVVIGAIGLMFWKSR